MQLLKWGKAILGKRLFGTLMKASFYGHFVAGEDRHSIKPTINRMHSFGVKSILDYSVEEDVSPKQEDVKESESVVPDIGDMIETHEDLEVMKEKVSGSIRRYRPHGSSIHDSLNRRYKLTGARTYFYEGEATCEKNMETFLRCIEAVAGEEVYVNLADVAQVPGSLPCAIFWSLSHDHVHVSDSTDGTGFSAIKMTALGRPSLLVRRQRQILDRLWYHGPFLSSSSCPR